MTDAELLVAIRREIADRVDAAQRQAGPELLVALAYEPAMARGEAVVFY